MDAQTFPCVCHPQVDAFSRRINHSSKAANVKPFCCTLKFDGQQKEVVLFKALVEIPVELTELKFDYGVNQKSFRGEGLDLEWLDD